MVNKRYQTRNLRVIGWIVCLVAASGCATVNVASVGEQGYTLEEDEVRLHTRSKEVVDAIEESGKLYSDPELDVYLTTMVQKLVPGGVSTETLDIQVRVLRNPFLNAFALPNGRIYLHTGILAAMDNEAQLVVLLGHELGHVLERHALKKFRSSMNKSAFWAALVGALDPMFAELGTVSSIAGYSRYNENESDRIGFQSGKKLGYDMEEGVKLFDHMRQSIEDEDVKVPFFFSTHPNVVSRIEHFKVLLENEQAGTGDKVGAEVYQNYVRKVLLVSVADCLDQGMFKTAETYVTKYMNRYPDDFQGWYLSGELYRQRQDTDSGSRKKRRVKEDDYVKAISSYEKSSTLNPDFADNYQGMGRVYQHMKEDEKAKVSFRKYLALKPDAGDRLFIEQYIQGLL